MSKFRVCRIIKPDSILNNMIISKEEIKSLYPKTFNRNSSDGFKVGDRIWLELPPALQGGEYRLVEGSGKTETKLPIYSISYTNVDSILIPYDTYKAKAKEDVATKSIQESTSSLGKRFQLMELTDSGWTLVLPNEQEKTFFGFVSNRNDGVLAVASSSAEFAVVTVQFVLIPKDLYNKQISINTLDKLKEEFSKLLASKNININDVKIRELQRYSYVLPVVDSESLSPAVRGRGGNGSYLLTSYGAEYNPKYRELSVFGVKVDDEDYILDSGYNQ